MKNQTCQEYAFHFLDKDLLPTNALADSYSIQHRIFKGNIPPGALQIEGDYLWPVNVAKNSTTIPIARIHVPNPDLESPRLRNLLQGVSHFDVSIGVAQTEFRDSFLTKPIIEIIEPYASEADRNIFSKKASFDEMVNTRKQVISDSIFQAAELAYTAQAVVSDLDLQTKKDLTYIPTNSGYSSRLDTNRLSPTKKFIVDMSVHIGLSRLLIDGTIGLDNQPLWLRVSMLAAGVGGYGAYFYAPFALKKRNEDRIMAKGFAAMDVVLRTNFIYNMGELNARADSTDRDIR